jgi:hypothetical protein
MVPNSQQREFGFIPETRLCAATFFLSDGWSGAVDNHKVRRIMTVG